MEGVGVGSSTVRGEGARASQCVSVLCVVCWYFQYCCYYLYTCRSRAPPPAPMSVYVYMRMCNVQEDKSVRAELLHVDVQRLV